MYALYRVVRNKVASTQDVDNTSSTNIHIVALIKQVELLVKVNTHVVNTVNMIPICEN